MNKNVISIIDGAAGSCGKAKVVGEVATDKSIKIGAAVTNCMPNAGHTFVDENGSATVFRNIPVSSVNKDTELFIGPGSAIDMDVFKEEYESASKYVGERKIYVHEMVPLIESRHKQYEKEHIKSGSTFKGCGAVSQEKIIREAKLQFFKDFKNAIVCSNDEWLQRLYSHLDKTNEYIILEGSQGCDLSINFSGNYPYVTSRNVSTSQSLADSGIPAERLLETIMVIRPFPIRISNTTQDGRKIYTGAYGNGEELSWSEINVSSAIGTYPIKNNLDDYANELFSDKDFIKRFLLETDISILKQILSEKIEYYISNPDKISLLQLCEIDRLNNKTNDNKEYQPLFIDIPTFDEEFYDSKGIKSIYDFSEQTTVTKKERRVFDIDINKLKNNCLVNAPYGLYLNFFQQLDSSFIKQKGKYEDFYFNRYLREYFNWIEENSNTNILALGTGANNGERILKKNLIK